MGHEISDAFSVSASALSAERTRMNVVASNLANANVLKTAEGGPYRRRQVVFEPMLDRAMAASGAPNAGGVRARVVVDHSAGELRHDPGNPYADKDGYVRQTNVSPMFEMVDLMTAARSYEANLGAIRVYREMVQKTIQMGR
jgi:flagellar basal-body rod protein FlgC